MKLTFKFEKRGQVCTFVRLCHDIKEAVAEFEATHAYLNGYTLYVERLEEVETKEEIKARRMFKFSVALVSVALLALIVFVVIGLSLEGVI